MDGSGKDRVFEHQAAGLFVSAILLGAREEWPSIADQINQLLESVGCEGRVPQDDGAAFEFILAIIAEQIQALPNLFSGQQARRLRDWIVRSISAPDLGTYPADAIEEYQDAYDECQAKHEPPFVGIASLLFDKLGVGSTLAVGGAEFKHPVALMALSEHIVKFGGPWWKEAVDRYELVP
jgi:hypothetical protein